MQLTPYWTDNAPVDAPVDYPNSKELAPLNQSRPADRVKQKVLYRFCWNVLGSVKDIKIEAGLNDDDAEQRYPFLSDPIAMETLTIPPVARLQVFSVDISAMLHFHIIPKDYEFELLTIENPDGSPITIKDFVVKTHEYLALRKVVLRKYRKPSNSPHLNHDQDGYQILIRKTLLLYVEVVSSKSDGKTTIVCVETVLEGEFGRSAEEIWEEQRSCAIAMASHRVCMVLPCRISTSRSDISDIWLDWQSAYRDPMTYSSTLHIVRAAGLRKSTFRLSWKDFWESLLKRSSRLGGEELLRHLYTPVAIYCLFLSFLCLRQ